MRYVVYRLLGGKICRQDINGGRWSELSAEEAELLLSRLSQYPRNCYDEAVGGKEGVLHQYTIDNI